MLQTIIADMMKALREVGAEQTVVRRRNHLSVRSSMIECDYYRLLEGDSAFEGRAFGTVSSGLRMGVENRCGAGACALNSAGCGRRVDGSRGILWYRMCRRNNRDWGDVRC